MDLTKNIEDYLKAIFSIASLNNTSKVGTNELAEYLGLSPASVSSMLKKMKAKSLVHYEKYSKLELTPHGEDLAIYLVRKHRLWETFLCEHLNFSWDEVHDVAHQLEHVQSKKLIRELDHFLGYPKRDPHGDIIPNAQGDFMPESKELLSSLNIGDSCKLVSVKDSSVAFLKYVTQIGLALSSEILIKEIREFDDSMLIAFDNKVENVSKQFADNIFVQKVNGLKS